MTTGPVEKRVVVADTPAALAQQVAGLLVRLLVSRTEEQRVAHIALTGGSMGGAVLRAAAEDPQVSEVDWSLVHFWWGDERFVALDDPDRNSLQSRQALLDRMPIPADNIHEVASPATGLSLDEAAEAYADDLARFSSNEYPWPSFTVCFLGVGPDAHIASLFPGRPEISVTDAAALPVRDSPKPPPERVTLTLPVLNSAERVWLVLTGSDKAEALEGALTGTSHTSVPAAGAQGRDQTVFFADRAAAAKVRQEFVDRDY